MKQEIRNAFYGASIGVLLLCSIINAAHAQSVQPRAPANDISQPMARTLQQPAPAATPSNVRATEHVVDQSVPDDPAVVAIIAPYSAKVHSLDQVIGKLEGDLKKGGIGAGSMGNFVADALRAQAEKRLGKPVLLAVTNSGGLRKDAIAAGDLRARDIYELLPFENSLVALDLTGEQLLRFFRVVVAARDAQSGARITYRMNQESNNPAGRSEAGRNELVSVKLGEGQSARDIDPAATYTIVTIDYLVKRGGNYAVLQEAKSVRPLGITMRDAVLDYIKAEAAAGRLIKATLDGRFQQEKSGSTEKENKNH